MPDKIYFPCMLRNIGATNSDRSLTLEEIPRWTAMEPEKVRSDLQS